MKVTYYVAASLDGYIAKPDGDVSWLEELNIPPEEAGYEEFFSTVDALVMGRGTYDIIYAFGAWPYGEKPVWVCSNSVIKELKGANLQRETSLEDAISSARKLGVKHLWLVGGGKLAASFLRLSLVTDISVALMPIVLGEGIPLFGSLSQSIRLRQVACESHKSGFTQIEYKIGNE